MKVTNVYFSTESSVMIQISQHCHASITHPTLDAKGAERTQPIVAAAQWYTRRRNDTYRNTPTDLHSTSPSDPRLANFSTPLAHKTFERVVICWDSAENNQPVRSFDDPHCLICPIGHRDRMGTGRHSSSRFELLGKNKTSAGPQTGPRCDSRCDCAWCFGGQLGEYSAHACSFVFLGPRCRQHSKLQNSGCVGTYKSHPPLFK